MSIINGRSGMAINVFFYQMLKIQFRRLKQDLKIYFDEKDITLDIKAGSTDYTYIYLYFFKDKTIKEMNDYIVKSLKEKKKHNYDIDYSLYDQNNADVERSINFDSFHMWNGQPITNEINLRLLTLKHIQSSSYYNRVKPNYDKHIDGKLSDIDFENKISCFISENLSYPFNMKFNSIEEEKAFVYAHDDDWHANFLYEERVKSEKYNLCYSLFDKIYKKNKDYYVKGVKYEENGNILVITFVIKDKHEYEYNLSYSFEKYEEKFSHRYSGEDISYTLPKYIDKDTCKILVTKVEDKKYKSLMKKFETLF